jgi:hypothetical protein
MLWGYIEHTFFHAPTKATTVEINTICILPAKICRETWSKGGGFACDLCVVGLSKHLLEYLPYFKEQKYHVESMILYTVSQEKKSSTMIRPPNYIYLFSK